MSGTALGMIGLGLVKFRVDRVIKGPMQTGELKVDLSEGGYAPVGEYLVALLDRRGSHLVPATLDEFCGSFAFIPAGPAAAGGREDPLQAVVAAVGALVTASGASARLRRSALNFICPLPEAAHVLVAASKALDPGIRYAAISCRLQQGDLGLLLRLADTFSTSLPPPEAASLAGTISDLYNYGFHRPGPTAAIDALARMARTRSPALRSAAIAALGNSFACAAIPPLRLILQQGGPSDRVAAANALSYIVPGPPRPITAEQLSASDGAIRKKLVADSYGPTGCLH